MSRDQLKEIVKECLVELLSEGLGGTLTVPSGQRQQPTAQNNRTQISGVSELSRSNRRIEQRQRSFDPRLDTPISQINSSRTQTPALREAIKRESGGNSVMESILADTAQTTLVSQMAYGDSSANGGSSSPRPSQQEQFHGAPEEVFGEETASRWANLAFADAPSRRIA